MGTRNIFQIYLKCFTVLVKVKVKWIIDFRKKKLKIELCHGATTITLFHIHD